MLGQNDHKEDNKMKKYEVMFILRSNLDQDAIKAEIEAVKNIFTSNDSKVLEVKELGLRELAYEIEHNRKGYYVLMNVEATKEAVNEFNRIAGYSEKIIRFIVVKDGE
jgi:small subunit ribosomal protein S6